MGGGRIERRGEGRGRMERRRWGGENVSTLLLSSDRIPVAFYSSLSRNRSTHCCYSPLCPCSAVQNSKPNVDKIDMDHNPAYGDHEVKQVEGM